MRNVSKLPLVSLPVAAVKLKLQKEWVPEYEPQELRPPQVSVH